jgi:hypothetical protein
MTKFYNSGLGEVSIYSKQYGQYPFYTAYYLSDYFSDSCLTEQEKVTCLLKEINYNLPLLTKHYRTTCGINYGNSKDIHQKIRDQFELNLTKSLNWHWNYYESLVWDENIAIECDLVPFQFGGMNLLSAGWLNNEINFLKLESYELLVHNTIDENGDFFDSLDEDYIISVLKKETVEKVLNRLSQALSITKK